MKEKFKKIASYMSILTVFLSIVVNVYASSYTTSYQFSVSVTGQTRYFDGTNISFTSRATSTPFIHSTNKTYSVALYRDKLIDDYIGSVTLYRDILGTAKWSNVGVGNYYVFLSKANDGVTLVDNNVVIKNY
ncbi:hypothetical protein EOM39_01065 [Candidatus Gracilibacteria bacterium]|nr:hypothetical protein [Candidatus Gracilibacteria bacterium]